MALDSPMPAGYVVLRDAEVTPAMGAWARKVEHDTRSLPGAGYGSIFLEHFGGKAIAARVEHHTWTTDSSGQQIPCVPYCHGVTLYHAPASAGQGAGPAPPVDGFSRAAQILLLAAALFGTGFATATAILHARARARARALGLAHASHEDF